MELVGGGSVINGAYPVYFLLDYMVSVLVSFLIFIKCLADKFMGKYVTNW